jgi:DNA-binding MarR family transcriptional regulator
MDETHPGETLEEIAAVLAEVTTAMIRHLSDRQGLSLTTASTLIRLEREGSVRLTALAAAEGVAQPSMTQLVQRLERQGLVERVSDPEDRRVTLVAITDAGRALLAERGQFRRTRLAEMLATLPAEEREALGSAMRAALPIIRRMTYDAGQSRVPSDGTAP